VGCGDEIAGSHLGVVEVLVLEQSGPLLEVGPDRLCVPVEPGADPLGGDIPSLLRDFEVLPLEIALRLHPCDLRESCPILRHVTRLDTFLLLSA